MSVVEDDDVIEHIATYTPDEPFAGGILPGTARGDLDLCNAHVLDAVLEGHTVDHVPIPEEIARRGLPGKRLDDLLGGPLRRGMFSNIAMHDATALVSQHDKHKQDLEAGSWHDEEITRHNVFDVIIEKGLPCGRGRLADARPVLLHRGFGHSDAQLPQLTHNARRPPQGIGAPHVPDEIAHFFGKGRTASLASLAQLSPVIPEPFLLPGNDGARLHERQGLLPARPQARQPAPEEAISWPKLGTRNGVLIDSQLMPQGHVFEAQRLVRPKVRYNVSDEG